MGNWILQKPVAFLIFNRPDTTARVFEAIRQVQPPVLLIVADGPRPDRTGELERCLAARAVIEQVDWECKILKNYSDINLGCKQRVSSGLDWVFSQVDEAIILEDDCLPDATFFRFCEEMLDQYRHDTRIMHISGDNFQFGQRRGDASYYFSRHIHIWGWATWKRAWSHYDVAISQWPELKAFGWLNRFWQHPDIVRYWEPILQKVYEGKIDTWDYQWTFACWINGGLGIIPEVNLISNIGFRGDAHHTTNANSIFANMPTPLLAFPLQHPNDVVADQEADLFTFNNHFKGRLRDTLTQLIWSLFAVLKRHFYFLKEA